MINFGHMTRAGYDVNSYGYRAPEFDTVDWRNSYIIQGCSAIFGVGTADPTKITQYYLSEMLGAPVINLGVPGSGMEVQYVNALEFLEAGIKPKGVFIVYPGLDRYTLYNNGNLEEHVGPWCNERKLEWMLNDNSRMHNLFLVRGYRMLWKLAGVPLLGEWSHHGDNRDFCEEVISWDNFLDFGDDNQHWGSITSKAVAEILFNQFSKRITKTIE